MKIKNLFNKNKPTISFEVFPPKREDSLDTIFSSLLELASLKPDFISVTHGAGGSKSESDKLIAISTFIKNNCSVPALSHLTCVAQRKKSILDIISSLKENGVENILALRGDGEEFIDYRYASDLISHLKKHDFCIGAACYPEGHIDNESLESDILYLKLKQERGADFFISQLFFENSIFYRFLEKTKKSGITRPIIAGVMPILSKEQIQRMIFLCGASLPSSIIRLINKYKGDDLVRAGIDYAKSQVQDLCKNGIAGVHIYTMNKPFIAKEILN